MAAVPTVGSLCGRPQRPRYADGTRRSQAGIRSPKRPPAEGVHRLGLLGPHPGPSDSAALAARDPHVATMPLERARLEGGFRAVVGQRPCESQGHVGSRTRRRSLRRRSFFGRGRQRTGRHSSSGGFPQGQLLHRETLLAQRESCLDRAVWAQASASTWRSHALRQAGLRFGSCSE